MKAILISWFIILFIVPLKCVEGNSNFSETQGSSITVVALHTEKLIVHITILLFILFVILLKIVYHRLKRLAAYVPESCILIILGVIFGAIIKHAAHSELKVWNLSNDLFFLYLLPPIILDSSFVITNRVFASNIGIILLFAVIGTILNFLIIGVLLYALQVVGAIGCQCLDLKTSLLYSSLIVAVDPVAVLAIFEDIGVNKALYYMVFGESLLNDAVTIVVYSVMVSLSGIENITGTHIGLGIAKFFTVSLGGLLIGVMFGVFTCVITRFTCHSLRVLEPLIIISMAYLSYIVSDMFEWSGLISMIGCGVVQAGYAFHNIDSNSVLVCKRMVKMLSNVSEAVIFMYLGLELMMGDLIWHTGFHLWSLVLCLLARLIIVFVLCLIVNSSGTKPFKISFTEQFVITYGGLRGAVAFSLAALIKPEILDGGVRMRGIIISSTFFTIFFTVVLMGLTMKPLAKLLRIKLLTRKPLSLIQELSNTVNSHMRVGIEAVCGERGDNYTRHFLDQINHRYIRRFLQVHPETREQRLVKTYEKVSLAIHYAMTRPANSQEYLENLSEGFKGTKHLPYAKEFYKGSFINRSSNYSLQNDEETLVVDQGATTMSNDVEILDMFLRARSDTIWSEDVNNSGKISEDFERDLKKQIQNRKRAVSAMKVKKNPKILATTSRTSRTSKKGEFVNKSFVLDETKDSIEMGEIVRDKND